MRILILANYDLGLYKFRKELIEELLRQKNKVYISLPDGDLVRPFEKMGCKYINTYVDRRGINPLKDYKLFCYYHKIMNKIKPDLVITYTIHLRTAVEKSVFGKTLFFPRRHPGPQAVFFTFFAGTAIIKQKRTVEKSCRSVCSYAGHPAAEKPQ